MYIYNTKLIATNHGFDACCKSKSKQLIHFKNGVMSIIWWVNCLVIGSDIRLVGGVVVVVVVVGVVGVVVGVIIRLVGFIIVLVVRSVVAGIISHNSEMIIYPTKNYLFIGMFVLNIFY